MWVEILLFVLAGLGGLAIFGLIAFMVFLYREKEYWVFGTMLVCLIVGFLFLMALIESDYVFKGFVRDG